MDLSNYTSITSNSLEVEPGGVFVAIKGIKRDGHNYIEDAVNRGAKLIVVDENYDERNKNFLQHIFIMKVADTTAALNEIASKIYMQPENIVAVTGTDGKTSVANFYYQIISKLGYKAASMGTLGIIAGDYQENFKSYGDFTTPGGGVIYKNLGKMRSLGINNVILEASSHGLEQSRMSNVKVKAAAFTSFSQDHLDYHKSMESYLDSKLILFSDILQEKSPVVINSDMGDVSLKVVDFCKDRGHNVITYGNKAKDLIVDSIKYKDGYSYAKFSWRGKDYNKKFNFIGDFQIHNIMCAACLAISMNFKEKEILEIIETLESVPGRMQKVTGSNIIIDFAHTPSALQKALQTLKDSKASVSLDVENNDCRLIVVFGCGGDRDTEKRFKMGAVARELADITIVTNDNPRTENPKSIRKMIMQSCPDAIEIGDRREAIAKAISLMRKNDLVLIAGKGHEKTQKIGNTLIEFDDYAVAKNLISTR